MQKMFSGDIYDDKVVKISPKEAASLSSLPKFKADNPQVFFDLSIGNEGDEDY